LRFGGLDVGAAAQQAGGHAGADARQSGLGQPRAGAGQRKAFGCLAEQQGQRGARLLPLQFKRRDQRALGFNQA
jgi:hypothetical protein